MITDDIVLFLHSSLIDDQSANDAQLPLQEVQAEKQRDLGMTTDIGLDDGTLTHLFIQTSAIKSTFARFPEHVIIDAVLPDE